MIEVWIDGLCEPINPWGAACLGYVIKRNGAEIDKGSDVIGVGQGMTNNVAEYTALIRALERVRELKLGKEEIIVRSDSKLVVNQMKGEFKVKARLLLPLYTKAKILANGLDITFKWIPREENAEADELSRVAYNSVPDREKSELKKGRKTERAKYYQF